jgi:tetratricopeptide (TPR) repeat protein
VGLRRFFTLIKKKDYAAANKVAEQVSDAQPANTYLQNELAWEIVSDATIEQRDLALAEKIAARAVEASKSKDGNILDTLACVLFMEGKRDRAVTVEEQAVNLGDNRKEMFQKTLEAYEKGTDKPDVLNRQAEQFKSDGELAKAEATWREELALEQKLWETNPARWAGTVQQLTDVLGMDKKTDDAEKLFASVLTPTFASQKESANMLRARGNFFAKHGRWKEAAADFAKVIALTPDDHYDFFVLAILQVQCGDWDAYQSLCAKILARFGETTNPTIAERMAKDCLFTGNSGTDLATVCKMADLAVTKGNSPYVQFVKGLAEYRQGHFASAAEYLPKALGGRDPYVNAGAELVLAMTQYQLKQTDAAQASLAKGAELIDSKTPKIDKGEVGDDWWNDWIINRVLLGEARKLVGTAAIVADRATSQPAK